MPIGEDCPEAIETQANALPGTQPPSPARFSELCPTGVAPLDKQHGQIHRALSNLCETLQVHSSDFILHERIEHLMGLAQDHFSSEEDLMAGVDYPGFAQHCSAHQLMLARIRRRIQHALEAGDPPLPKLAQEVLEAFAKHIQQSDMEFADYLRKLAQ